MYIFIYLNVCLGIYVNYCAVFIVVALTCPFMAPPCKNWPLFSGGVAGREVELDGERDEGKIKPKL